MAYTRQQAVTDMVKFLEMAEEAESLGDRASAGLYRVEAHNCIDRVGMKKPHCPNVGPYTSSNPKHCIHCMKQGGQWVEGEECIPTAPVT